MSINNPTPNIINTGQATATIPANANSIIATIAKAKINKHKVIIVVPPFWLLVNSSL